MKLGVMPFAAGRLADPHWLADLAGRVEAGPAESLWAYEHVAFPAEYSSIYPYDPAGRMTSADLQEDRPDPLEWLAVVAGMTERVKLGTGLMLLPLHNPLVLAKRLATLDRLSGGRLIAGFGIGWLSEEYDALGVPFRERGSRADEYLAILDELWKPGAASFHGKYHDFDNVYSNPKPHDGRRVAITIGGHSRAAMRRTARHATGVFLLRQTPERLAELLGELAEETAAVGRSLADIEVTVDAPRDAGLIEQYRELGVGRLLLSLSADDPARFADRIDRYVSEYLPAGVSA